MKTLDYTGIKTPDKRWEDGYDHDPRSEKIARAVGSIDFELQDDSLGLSFGGDGDNGEALLYALDVYFELLDKGRITD